MARRLAKIMSWSFVCVIVLLLAGYATLYVVNLEDRPPAAEIEALSSLLEDDSPLLSDDNAYLFMLGFEGDPATDPMALGHERYAWMQEARPAFEPSGDPLGDGYGYRAMRSEAVSELARTCSESELECSQLLETDKETVDQWIAGEQWLLDRYRSMIAMTEFNEATPFELLAPSPPFSVILDGQKLHMADASRSAAAGDAATVRSALDRDLTFWRMVLEHSDVLLTKMIATAGVIRHFKLGNIVLRRLPQEVVRDAIPTAWRTAISDAERSMMRSLAGEWQFFNESIARTIAETEAPLEDVSPSWTGYAVLDRAAWALLKPFFKLQDLRNRHARLLLDLGNAFDVPYSEVPYAVGVADELQESAYRPFSRLYNLAGDIVMASDWHVSDYAVRVADLEGIRRSALLAAELRALGTTSDNAFERINTSDIVNPYTGEPFVWIEAEGVILFNGLQASEERSTHKLIL